MPNHFDLSDDEFEEQFACATLDPGLFNHEAHLRLAWIHILKYGVEQAVKNVCNQIKTFDATFGDGTKYNATVTAAAVRAVHHFAEKSTTDTFMAFIQENPRLKNNLKDLLASHYAMDIFKDRGAKETILDPDLLAF